MIVEGSIGLLKVAVTVTFIFTPIAIITGLVELMVGAMPPPIGAGDRVGKGSGVTGGVVSGAIRKQPGTRAMISIKNNNIIRWKRILFLIL